MADVVEITLYAGYGRKMPTLLYKTRTVDVEKSVNEYIKLHNSRYGGRISRSAITVVESQQFSEVTFERFDRHIKGHLKDLLEIIEDAFANDGLMEMIDDYILSLEKPATIYFVVYDNMRVGTFELKNNSSSAADLCTFGIHTKYQRLGIGSKVIEKLLLEHDRLYVKHSTKAGLGLYDKYVNVVVMG